ncbi:c-type cytochrome [Lutimonas zeaxanthinifaciens]|uniref:c-type cytochrome n=1 Tax=Lutimonas zeaxanthinifaciens TaxID=3060215 RepID=UPI00265CBF53|nr:c-type cytochrome [Lutimonas sp. YSD2104]WKK65549.1 c-type cytochrome [Lutimonas sp. YSD2104]
MSSSSHHAVLSRFYVSIFFSFFVLSAGGQIRNAPLTKIDAERASKNYQQYCALCHGTEREGNAADYAPSLRSKSLMSTMPLNFLASSIGFGRPNTAMAAYLSDSGGPLTMKDIFILATWLKHQSGAETISLPLKPIDGDPVAGSAVYQQNCTECHGVKAEGITAPALANPAFLAFATDEYIKYAIVNGRDNTEMQAFNEVLSDRQINDLTAYIRSLTSGWSPEPKELSPYPKPGAYVTNPNGDHPDFKLREGRYVPMKQVAKALKEGKRIVLLDTRTTSEWHNAHIPGAIPIPYYITEEKVDEGLPKDKTWIIAYCSCPHAASDKIINMLRKKGFKNTAVIDEGFFNWINAGHPIIGGKPE